MKSLEHKDRRFEEASGRSLAHQRGTQATCSEKRLTPAARPAAGSRLIEQYHMSQVRPCRLVGLDRSSLIYQSVQGSDSPVRERLGELAAECLHCG